MNELRPLVLRIPLKVTSSDVVNQTTQHIAKAVTFEPTAAVRTTSALGQVFKAPYAGIDLVAEANTDLAFREMAERSVVKPTT